MSVRAVRRAFVLAIVAALELAAVAWAAGVGRPPTIDIAIHYSHFTPSEVRVPVDVPVTFVIHNEDPIDHEWIVGDAAVHAYHRTSAEPLHAAVPTEVPVPALSTATTTVTFAEPGRLAFICHLPGHEAYGMVGWVTIAP